MKKFAAILLMLLYGFSSSGMSVELHYCCGKLKKIVFFSLKQHQCPMSRDAGSETAFTEKAACGTSHNLVCMRCCEVKKISQQEKQDQIRLQAAVKLLNTPAIMARPALAPSFVSSAAQPIISFTNTYPPGVPHPLFILNCVFRI